MRLVRLLSTSSVESATAATAAAAKERRKAAFDSWLTSARAAALAKGRPLSSTPLTASTSSSLFQSYSKDGLPLADCASMLGRTTSQTKGALVLAALAAAQEAGTDHVVPSGSSLPSTVAETLASSTGVGTARAGSVSRSHVQFRKAVEAGEAPDTAQRSYRHGVPGTAAVAASATIGALSPLARTVDGSNDTPRVLREGGGARSARTSIIMVTDDAGEPESVLVRSRDGALRTGTVADEYLARALDANKASPVNVTVNGLAPGTWDHVDAVEWAQAIAATPVHRAGVPVSAAMIQEAVKEQAVADEANVDDEADVDDDDAEVAKEAEKEEEEKEQEQEEKDGERKET